MINLYLCNGDILLYNVDDWSVLRKQHRIVGEIVGNSLHVIPSLPLKILPEEACLLMDRNIVTVLEPPKDIVHTELDKTNSEYYEAKLLAAQIVEYKETRRAQIETIVDRISAKPNETRTRQEIINEQLAKSPSVTQNNMIWPIHLSSPTEGYQKLSTFNLQDILQLTTPLKCAVYSDLWNKGYYVTQGHKFGGDFLVYFGEPLCHHAIFIVKCVDSETNISPTDIVALGRLGTSVKKRAVLASLTNNTVSYITINWIDA